jgi:predicted dehydrogenase
LAFSARDSFANSTLLPVLKNNKDFELVGIASSGGLHAQHSGKKFGFQYATSSEDEIINDPKINSVADSHSSRHSCGLDR